MNLATVHGVRCWITGRAAVLVYSAAVQRQHRFKKPFWAYNVRVLKFLLNTVGLGLLVLCSPVFSQTATFSPQGASVLKNQAGQVIKGVQILDVLVCSPVPATISNGLIYQTAIANGFSAIGPAMGTALLNQHIAKDWKHFTVTLLTDGALDAAIGGLTGIVAMPAGLVKGLAIGHAFMDKFGPQLLATAPSDAGVLSILMDPSKSTTFTAAASCVEGTMLAQYAKGSHAVGPVVIGAIPVAAPPAHAAISSIPEDCSAAAYEWVACPDIEFSRLQKIMAMHASAAKYYETGEF